MCIRDSVYALDRAPLGGKRVVVSVRVLGSDGPAFTDAAPPVSYTHLRAHETVLDLVCRLLLEKKKTQYTQIDQ